MHVPHTRHRIFIERGQFLGLCVTLCYALSCLISFLHSTHHHCHLCEYHYVIFTPHICHNHHNRWSCKSFESSVKFSTGYMKEVFWVYSFLQSVQSYTWCNVSPTLQFYTMCDLPHNSTFISQFSHNLRFELSDGSLRCFVAMQLLLQIYAVSSVEFPHLKLR